MTPEQFCYWLQGFGELTNDAPSPEQWKAIKEHLQTVFHKVTPPFNPIPYRQDSFYPMLADKVIC